MRANNFLTKPHVIVICTDSLSTELSTELGTELSTNRVESGVFIADLILFGLGGDNLTFPASEQLVRQGRGLEKNKTRAFVDLLVVLLKQYLVLHAQ